MDKPQAWPAWHRLKQYFDRYDVLMLVLLACLTGGVWFFAELADEVIEGETHVLDEAVLLAMRNPADRSDPLGPPWMEELGRDFTALGGIGFLTFLTLATAGFLALQGNRRLALLVLITVGGGLAASSLLKLGFERPRPDLVPHGSYVYTTSFPSGHSMLAAVTYLTLGILLARVQPRRLLKIYVLTLSIGITVLVGVSRIYLGVHWPTDVLAGWTAGAVWALMVWIIARWLQQRGQVEPEVNEST